MKWGHHFDVGMKAVIAPGDMKQRQQQPHVVALAETFKTHGGAPGNVPWVVKARGGWKLVAGRDRVAALMLIGAKHVTLREILDATAEDLADLEEIENLFRRPVPNRDELLARRVAKEAEAIKVERATSRTSVQEVSAPAHRPKSAVGEARERVAAMAGTTPDAVRKAEERAKAREEGAGQVNGATRPVPPPPPIEAYGHPLPDHVAVGLNLIVQAFAKADKLLQQAQAALGELGMTSFSPGIAQRLKAAVHDAAALVRSERPTHLCPYCKGKSQPVTGPFCKGCQEHGFVTAATFVAAPPEKRVSVEEHAAGLDPVPDKPRRVPTIKAGVTYTTDDNGNVVEQKPAKSAKAPKRMTIEVNGEALSIEELEKRVNAVPAEPEGDDGENW